MARWSNLTDTAAYFAVTPRLLRSMVFDGRLPKRKLGGRLVFNLDEIEARLMGGVGAAQSGLSANGPGHPERRAS